MVTLLRLGASPAVTNAKGMSCFDVASQVGSPAIREILARARGAART